MTFFDSLAGMVEGEILSADPAALLETITAAGIVLHHVTPEDDVTLRFVTSRSAVSRLREIAANRGEELKILHRYGIYWTIKRLLHRPVLVTGMCMLILLLLYLPSRVLFVQVEGNTEIPAQKILEAAEDCGIRFGASRRDVRSERIKNALLQAVPQLQWAGVNTYGCVAVVSVQERSVSPASQTREGVCSIVAARDGIITSGNATSGNLLCRPGQAVRAGEVLISGYTDCGIAIQATRANGEIYARTVRQISVISPAVCRRRTVKMDWKGSCSIILGKKRINLWKDSGIWDTTCDRIYEEYYVTLPGGFRLPVGLVLETYRFYETEKFQIAEATLQSRMENAACRYLKSEMVAGQIQNQKAVCTLDGEYGYLAGEYICTEMIGKVQWEQIGENDG